MVDQNAALGLIDELRVAVPEEVRAAKRINAEGERIIEKAQEEAERIVARAQEQAAFLIDERGLTQAADAQSRQIIDEARADADGIRRGADEYAVGVLIGLEGDVVKTLQSIKNGIALLDERRASLDGDDDEAAPARRGRGWGAIPLDTVTPGGPAEAPLAWNVAGLLGDEPGADRVFDVEGARIDLGDEVRLAAPIDGRVRLVRTNRGILATADLRTVLDLECSRCLREVLYPVEIRLQEEYLPALDITTGRPVPIDDEPEVERLTDHHELDLEPPVRDAILLAEPIAPLCRPDCPGLCIVCGERLDEGTHDHPDDDIDPRMEALRGFRSDDA